jgi:hypothetical protein
MTSAVEPTSEVKADPLGVVVFALVSSGLSGTAQTLVQLVLILVGGIVFSYAPAFWVRPREVDSIAWASLVGLLGALAFTVVDTAILRPVDLYHWTWDEIGGGSGFWYIPVWWMGSATLAWLGSWIYSESGRAGDVLIANVAVITSAIAIVGYGVLGIAGLGFGPAVLALGFSLALVVHLIVAMVSRRR